jgi:RecJ-like exonuclease
MENVEESDTICHTCKKECDESLLKWCEECREKEIIRCEICDVIYNDKDFGEYLCKTCESN